jgi:hypothetical protein
VHGAAEPVRGLDPALDEQDPAGLAMAGQVGDARPEVVLLDEVADAAEEADGIEPAPEVDRAHVALGERHPRAALGGDGQHRVVRRWRGPFLSHPPAQVRSIRQKGPTAAGCHEGVDRRIH